MTLQQVQLGEGGLRVFEPAHPVRAIANADGHQGGAGGQAHPDVAPATGQVRRRVALINNCCVLSLKIEIASYSFIQVPPEVSAGGDRQEPRRPLGGADRARQGEVREQEVRQLVRVRQIIIDGPTLILVRCVYPLQSL